MRRLTRDSCLASVFFVARLGRSWRATKKPCNDFLSPRPPWRGETRIGLLERRKGKRERERQIEGGREGARAEKEGRGGYVQGIHEYEIALGEPRVKGWLLPLA